MNGLHMKQAIRSNSRATWATDLPVGSQPVASAQRLVEGKVQFELSGRVFVVALDHVETHRPGIVNDLEHHRPQGLKLIDVVAVGLAVAAGWRAVWDPF